MTYRTLFVGTLKQKTSLNLGGNNGCSGMIVQNPMCRDGQNRPVIRGTTLAGALISTARKKHFCEDIFCFLGMSPREISSKKIKKAKPSRWVFYNSHLVNKTIEFEIRQGVGIRQDTGAPAEGALYDIETLPCGTEWTFLMEVDTTDNLNLEGYAASSLLDWTKGYCWLGNSIARGLGWMSLENLCAYKIDSKNFELWPNSSQTLDDNIQVIKDKVDRVSVENFVEHFDIPAKNEKSWNYIKMEGEISVGERDNGYGIDGLSIGGHTASPTMEYNEHIVKPQGRVCDKIDDYFTPDTPLAVTYNKGQLQPFIPGSAIHGPIRHALSRWYRSQGLDIIDPNSSQEHKNEDVVQEWFGSLQKSSHVFVSDAYLQENKWKAVFLQHHAEDEFTAGAYLSSKFNRLMIIEGRFKWTMVWEIPVQKEKPQAMMEYLKKLTQTGHLPIGGGKWRSSGWVHWKLNEVEEI